MSRAYNFCAGPAALPLEVLEEAQRDLVNWQGSGLSIMEMSHRSDEIVGIATTAERDLRDLLGVSDDYAVLFIQGGATGQFSAVPLNLLGEAKSADYVNTGEWSKKAIKEAKRYCDVNVVASSESDNFTTIPAFDSWALNKQAAYLHYTPNETIGGVEYFWTPEVDVPLVADMSSTILSRPIDVNKFGLIYAGAQKNIGPAGLTIVIVRKDLLGKAHPLCPVGLDYQVAAENESMYNTPPTMAIYLAGLVFKWLKEQGGVQAMGEMNALESRLLEEMLPTLEKNIQKGIDFAAS